jgi:hypothetical protein
MLVEGVARQFHRVPAEQRLVTARATRAVAKALGRDPYDSIALLADDFA